MDFAVPVPFEEAIRAASEKGLLPTTASSRELRQLATPIRELSTFSARTPYVRHLQTIQDQITRLVSPETVEGRPALPGEYTNKATVRTALQESLRSLGYHPGTDPNHPVPGSLTDLSSDARVDLITQTLSDLARGRGKYEFDRDPDVLEAFPAQELYRLEETKVHRNWPQRWAAAGGRFFGGRMIALKSDDVWQNLGDGDGGYEDTLGLPYPPFAFNSGMWVEDISREEAIDLGLLAGDEVVKPNPERGWGAGLQLGVKGLSEALQNVLLQLTPGAQITDGVLSLLPNEGNFRTRVFGLLRTGLLQLVNMNDQHVAAGDADGRGGQFAARSLDAGSISEVVRAAAQPREYAWHNYETVSKEDADRIQRETPLDVHGYKRVLVSDEVRKILRDHGQDAHPVTEEDFKKLPETLRAAVKHMKSERAGKLDRLISLTPHNGTTIVVEEVRSGRSKLALKSLRKVPTQDVDKVIRTLRATP